MPAPRRRSVQVGSDPTVHFGERICTTRPSCSEPHTRSVRSPPDSPNSELLTAANSVAETILRLFEEAITGGSARSGTPVPSHRRIAKSSSLHVACGNHPVKIGGRPAAAAGTLIRKSCRIVQKQLHLFAGFDDYPKANSGDCLGGRRRRPTALGNTSVRRGKAACLGRPNGSLRGDGISFTSAWDGTG